MTRSEMSTLELAECVKINLANALQLHQWVFVDIAMAQLDDVITRLEAQDDTE